ncbi:BTB/POZ and MATH domain-containing protein 2-like [Triticum aestivum]|uniref:BTB/POZ and MATH domain-containing protein 2-like n=1 Tax=Triticum aestivum TaxID=4565 RepID=UPI001D01AFE9|nr:BTB/POZ and MATH domain-containing protein 2-like [Triticum aestivum]
MEKLYEWPFSWNWSSCGATLFVVINSEERHSRPEEQRSFPLMLAVKTFWWSSFLCESQRKRAIMLPCDATLVCRGKALVLHMDFATADSTCIFAVTNYSFIKETGLGNFLRSHAFQVGGYDWSVRFYPQGINAESQKHISIVGELMSENAEVSAIFCYRLISPGGQCTEWTQTGVLYLSSAEGKYRMGGWEKVMGKTFDLLSPQVKLPPPELSNDFADLLESKEGADVTFCVQGETFPAHRVVLAARSPVFRVQLCGPMMEKDGSYVIVEDMLPGVFRALIHFVYTDCLVLPFDGFDDEDRKEIVRHLLQAADRYAIEKLKLICEATLCSCLDVQTVATTYALADQHQCNDLKQACLKLMASPTILGELMASQDYENLKRKSSSTALEILESVCKFPKI